MPVAGAIYGSRIGPIAALSGHVQNGGGVTVAMAATTARVYFRFVAESTLDIKAVKIKWSAVSAPGTVRVSIQTIDNTTGKPSGTLYDANATVDITPATTSPAQDCTFATLPTTGLVVGTQYAVVLETTVAGTTQTLCAYVGAPSGLAHYPVICLTSTDSGSTINEVTNSLPQCALVMENDTVMAMGMLPFNNSSSTSQIYASNYSSMKIVLAASIKVIGVQGVLAKIGTPAGDLRVRIYSNSGDLILGTTVTLDKDSLVTNFSLRGTYFKFDSVVTFAAGAYRIVFDSDNSVAGNYYFLRAMEFLTADAVPSGFRLSTSTDSGANWSDSTTNMPAVALILDSLVEASGGGGGPLIGGRLIG